jgi:predicted exporter
MISRCLGVCGRIAVEHPVAVLLIAVILTVAAIIPPVFFVPAKFSASVSSLLPEENRSAEAFDRALDDFGTADEVYVLFRLRDPGDLGAVGPHVVDLASRLRRGRDFSDAYCRSVRPEERGFLEDELLRRGLLYLPPSGIAEVEEALKDRSVGLAVKRTADTLFTARDAGAKAHLILLRKLGLDRIFRAGLGDGFGAFRSGGGEDDEAGYLVAHPEGEWQDALLLLAATPRAPAQRMEYSAHIMALVRQEVDHALAGMPPALRQGIAVEYGGGYQVAVRYADNIGNSLRSTLLTSLLGVLLLFGYCYRRYGVILYIGVPLLMVICWTMGVAWIFYGKLNMISCSFAAVLVGLGVDYAIHIYNRYVEERAGGEAVDASFVTALSSTGSGVTIGMLTTSFSFFALMTTRFKGFSQFGILAGAGLALALPAMVFVLPALVVWRSRRGRGESPRSLKSVTFFLPQLAGLIERCPGVIATLGIGVALAGGLCAAMLPGALRFDERLASLRPSSDPVFEIGEEVGRRFSGKNPARQMVLATGDDEAAAMNRAAMLAEPLQALREEGVLESYDLLPAIVPAPVQQRARLERIAGIDFERISNVLKRELERRGLAEAPFEKVFRFLANHAAMSPEKTPPILPSDLRGTPVWRLLRRLVAPHKESYRLDPERTENAWKALEREGVLVLAETPTSRDLDYFFVEGARVTGVGLDYLGTRNRQEVRVRPEDDAREDAAFTESVEAISERLDQGQELVFANDLDTSEGDGSSGAGSLVGVGTEVDQELLTFLFKSDVRKITVYGDGWSVLSYIYPPFEHLDGLELKEDWVRRVREELRVDDERVLLTGPLIVAHDLASVVKADFVRVTVSVSVIAALVLLILYRRPSRVLLSLGPIILGLLYLAGIMALGGVNFNFVNVLVVPVIIGLGVDNGIHLVHRFFASGRDIRPVVTETGRAVVITNLTSMVGFGSLAVGSYPGLTSMGVLSILGLGATLIASVVVLPALLLTFVSGKRPEDQTGMDNEAVTA